MAFMASSSEVNHRGISPSSCYMKTAGSVHSQSNSLVSEFNDKFSVEEQSSPYAHMSSHSPASSHRATATSGTPGWPSCGQEINHMSPESSPMQAGSESSNRSGGNKQVNPGSSPSPEVLQSSDWPHMTDATMHFSKPIVSMAGSSPSHDVTRVHDMMGRLGSSNGVPPLASSQQHVQQQQVGSGILRHNSWSALDISNKIAVSVDTTRSSISLQGAGLATSHCLAQFTSDPGFAERAAKFSSFSNGTYSQVSQPYLPESKGRRSGNQQSVQDTDGKLSRSSSCSRLTNAGTSNVDRTGSSHTSVQSKSPNRDARERADGNNIDIEQEHAKDLETQMKQNDQKQMVERTVDTSSIEGATEAATATLSGFDTGDDVENSSCSEQGARTDNGSGGAPVVRSNSLGKRKVSPDRKFKDESASVPSQAADRDIKDNGEGGGLKRHKSGDQSMQVDTKGKTDRSFSENSGETSPTSLKLDSSKPPEPPKTDYIHVRARRGQATDSHSLAERVRRERISERMKFLQDLVPGCSKVTGKAVMLDEIINYVQSLQRQVEFLSMKLAAVNPRLDFNVDTFLAKEMQSQLSPPAMMMGGPHVDMGILPSYGHHQSHNSQQAQMQMGGLISSSGLDYQCHEAATASEASQIRRTMSAPVTTPLSCLDVYGDAINSSQTSSVWDGELQSIVNHMGFAQDRPTSLFPHALHCQLPAGHMKVEL